MTIKILALTGLLAATALTGMAFAQDAATFDKERVCAEQLKGNQDALSAVRNARPDEKAMRELLAAAVKRVPGNNICIADLLGDDDQDIANILGELAETDDNVEPAAGPEGGETPPEFPGGENNPGENPGQLNQPNGPSSSPSAPSVQSVPSS